MTTRLPLAKFDNNEQAQTAKLLRTPSKHKRSGSNIMSSIKKKGGKLRRNLTPPKNMNVGCAKTPVRTKTPLPLTFSPKFCNAHQYEIKSCEMDPSPFQIELPSHDSILVSCKICAVLDDYVELGGVDFDFSSLMPFGEKSPDINALLLGDANAASKAHPILAKLQDAVSDIAVQGFYRDHVDGIGRVEVCIFSSEIMRQFFVVYRGSSQLQDRPISGSQTKGESAKPDAAKENRDDDTPAEINNTTVLNTDVNAAVLKAYNETNLEESIFTLLNRLTGWKPFCDVTMIGHAFGGTLATLAACKYSKSKPAARVRCHVFGSPRMGGQAFRNEVHSLPNLHVIRIERSTDPFISLPENQGSEWTHVGHCLRLSPSLLTSFATADETRPCDVQLYRFDKLRPSSSFAASSVNSVCNFSKLKIGNEIRSYQKDLDKVSVRNFHWPDRFAGEVSGKHIANGYLV